LRRTHVSRAFRRLSSRPAMGKMQSKIDNIGTSCHRNFWHTIELHLLSRTKILPHAQFPGFFLLSAPRIEGFRRGPQRTIILEAAPSVEPRSSFAYLGSGHWVGKLKHWPLHEALVAMEDINSIRRSRVSDKADCATSETPLVLLIGKEVLRLLEARDSSKTRNLEALFFSSHLHYLASAGYISNCKNTHVPSVVLHFEDRPSFRAS